jgi:predicted polyphosphate/ATP-dependent NAD kinase
MPVIGLIVNPVAGMGGSVGLKGTDGDMHARALELGAEPVSPARTAEFLTDLTCADEISFLAAPGAMGSDFVSAAGLEFDTIEGFDPQLSGGDTKAAATAMLQAGVEAIVFAGGDGTARDMADAVGISIPVIAIPSGVKIYSSVFAYSPKAAAGLLDAFVAGTGASEEEVLDIDEDAFRDGRVDSRHYGFLLIPEAPQLVQAGKQSSGMSGSTAEAKQEIAEAVVEDFKPGTLYLLGSGTTVRSIADELGVEKTLLGVDGVIDGELVGLDLNEKAILELLDQHENAVIVITPLGGNGFIFGRGNKQFTPAVLRRVGLDHIIVVGNRDKLLKLPNLHVDSGDPMLDEEMGGYIDVLVGRGYQKTMRVL